MSATDGMTGGETGGCPRWLKLALILSLAANLVIAGIVIGHAVRDGKRGERGADRVVNWIVGMVPEARRDFARAHFAEAGERIDAARAQRITYLPGVVAAMRAEPFDPAALDKALETMFDRRNSGRTIVRERLITLLAELTPAERASFAAAFEERLAEREERRRE